MVVHLLLFFFIRKVEEQVTKAISAAQKLPIHASKMLDGSAEKSLYNKLVKRDGKSHSGKRSLQMYGPFKNFDPENFLTQKQIVNFVKANNKSNLTEFHKLKHNGVIFKSLGYKRSPRRSNAAIIFKTDGINQAGLIQTFLKVTNFL
ncbi:uncharacterized protein [Clytia hemisphaerica]|uniref:uncharacterized protein n=1 Tax=Clytia hemisphaerica TaxID=252671 RepID=UPI0034D69C10